MMAIIRMIIDENCERRREKRVTRGEVISQLVFSDLPCRLRRSSTSPLLNLPCVLMYDGGLVFFAYHVR